MSDAEVESLAYHESDPPGKIFTGLSKPVATQHDLTIAYSPGVAGPCRKIHQNQEDSFRYTGRGNLVGVVTNGTAVLGLGNIGPYAAKPVMEGKAMLFKKFANIDVFDIEMNCPDTEGFIAAVKALEPTFGGINLEDIKAPECFYIEEKLRSIMSIPVFHDDQHGTAIISGAAFLNALEITERSIERVRVVFSGGGAAAIGCARHFLELGVRKENLFLCDSQGVIYEGRDSSLNKYKAMFAQKTKLRTLEEALDGADAFIGVSVANVLAPAMIKKMAKNPIIFALANPDPEIRPDVAREARPDAIIATGRSDYPNQVNNVLGFPFIFRGALDVAARNVNTQMMLAASHAIASLAKENVPDIVMRAYDRADGYRFGRDYLIPKPVDPRVLTRVAPAVAKAAMDTGLARKHVDFDEYVARMERILGPTKKIMQSVRKEISAKRPTYEKKPLIVIPCSTDSRVIRAAAQIYYEGDVRLCLLGSEKHTLAFAEKNGIANFGQMVRIYNPLKDEKAMASYAEKLFEQRQRRGVSRSGADQMMRNFNYFAAMMVKAGDADAMVSGIVEPYPDAARPILEVFGPRGDRELAGVYMMVIKNKMYFFADCTINIDPDAETLCDIASSTAEIARRYTQDPIKIAMLSYSSFGSNRHPTATKVAEAVKMLHKRHPDLTVDGELQADVALNVELQEREFPFCALGGQANVLIFPDLGSANIAYKILSNLTDTTATGPLLTGLNLPGNVLQRSAGVDEIVNMIYLTAHQVCLDSDRK